jgi:beta-galactosidase
MQRRNFDDQGKIRNTLATFRSRCARRRKEENVALIDLTAMSIKFYEALGPDRAPLAFSGGRDATHHSDYGAYELAKCIVEGIRDNKLERLSFDADWRFTKGDPLVVGEALVYERIKDWVLPTGDELLNWAPPRAPRPAGNPAGDVSYARANFDDSAWRKLDLPHDWGIEGPFQQELSGDTGKLPWFGVGWYRKKFALPATDAGRQLALELDGAMAYAMVWCNGQFVGGWPYGYSSWRVDLTPYVKPGADNVVAIRLDNPRESSRWYPGGGIYRNVWLVKTAPVHVAPWGVFVTTPVVARESLPPSMSP